NRQRFRVPSGAPKKGYWRGQRHVVRPPLQPAETAGPDLERKVLPAHSARSRRQPAKPSPPPRSLSAGFLLAPAKYRSASGALRPFVLRCPDEKQCACVSIGMPPVR